MKVRSELLGGQIGVLFCLAGAVVIWGGWNGAASHDDISSQFPYLISGGIAGLALVVVGVGLIVVQTQRSDRATLELNLVELRRAVERLSAGVDEGEGTLVVAGPNSYHRAGCSLLEGREGLATMTPPAAAASGLVPCRTCDAVRVTDSSTTPEAWGTQ